MLRIRKFQPSDTNFVIATWLRNYKEQSYFAKRIIYNVYFKYHEPVVKLLIQRSHILISFHEKEPEVNLGFFCFETTPTEFIGHYIYVKKPFRGIGIAKEFIKESKMKTYPKVFFTHWTYFIDEVIDPEQKKMTYNPYLI